MKSKLILIVGLFLVVACGNKETKTNAEVPHKEIVSTPKIEALKPTATPPKVPSLSTYYGHYVGDFEAVTSNHDKKPSYFNKIE